MTSIEIRPHRWAGKRLKPPASSLCSQRKIRPSITRKAVPASAQARFGFSIQRAMLSVSFPSTTLIGNCDAVIHVNE